MPAPSSAWVAQSTKLQRETSPGSTVFVAISEVQDIGGPSEQVAVTEVTNHDSTGAVREWIGGLIDPGTLPFNMNLLYGDSSQDGATGFYYAFANRLRENYKVVTAASHGVYSMKGIPVKHDKKFPSDGKQATVAAEIKITGQVALV